MRQQVYGFGLLLAIILFFGLSFTLLWSVPKSPAYCYLSPAPNGAPPPELARVTDTPRGVEFRLVFSEEIEGGDCRLRFEGAGGVEMAAMDCGRGQVTHFMNGSRPPGVYRVDLTRNEQRIGTYYFERVAQR